MKFGDKFAFFGGLAGLVAVVVCIVIMIVTGWTLMIGKMLLGLVLCGSLFTKGLRAKRLAAAQNQGATDKD